MFITKWQKADKKNAYSVENTGYTFVPIKQMDPYVSSTPTSCQMKRPGRRFLKKRRLDQRRVMRQAPARRFHFRSSKPNG